MGPGGIRSRIVMTADAEPMPVDGALDAQRDMSRRSALSVVSVRRRSRSLARLAAESCRRAQTATSGTGRVGGCAVYGLELEGERAGHRSPLRDPDGGRGRPGLGFSPQSRTGRHEVASPVPHRRRSTRITTHGRRGHWRSPVRCTTAAKIAVSAANTPTARPPVQQKTRLSRAFVKWSVPGSNR